MDFGSYLTTLLSWRAFIVAMETLFGNSSNLNITASKIEANVSERVKNGPLQLQTYFVTTFDFKDIRENCT